MLEAAPAAVVLLMPRQPVSRLDRRLQALLAAELRVAGHHAVHDLAGVEDHRLAADLAEMPGERAVGVLDGEFPVDDPVRALDQIGAAENIRGSNERLDDVAAGFRVARQPPVFEAPAGRNATRVSHTIADVLRLAQPFDRADEMLAMIAWGLRRARPIRSRDNQPRMAWTPRTVSKGKSEKLCRIHRCRRVCAGVCATQPSPRQREHCSR